MLSNDKNDRPRNWSESLADFYHDLLSRIPPGLTIVFTSFVLWLDANEYAVRRNDIELLGAFGWAPTLVAIAGVGFATYAIGVIVSGLGNFVGQKLSRKVWQDIVMESRHLWVKETLQPFGVVETIERGDWGDIRWLDRYIHLSVSYKNMKHHRLIERSLAEVALLNNLVAAAVISVVLLVAAIYVNSGPTTTELVLLAALSLLLLLSLIAAPYRFESYLRTQIVLVRIAETEDKS